MDKNKKESVKMKKSILYNSFYNVVYQFLNVFFPFITSVYISHVIQADGIGKVAYAQNIVSYFVTLAPLGVLSYGVKEIATTKNDLELRNKKFSELFCLNFVSTSCFGFLYYFFILYQVGIQKERILFLVCGLQIVLNYINVDWFYQGIEEFAYITKRSFVIKILSMIAMLLWVRTREDYVIYALISCLAIGGNSVFNMIHLRKYIRFQWRNLRWKEHIMPELILACNILLANLYSKVDITMLGYWKDDAVTGYYSNAFKIVNLILCICLAVTDVLLPRLSYNFYEDREKFKELVNKGAEMVLFLILPTMIGLYLVAPVMIPILFGKSFIPSIATVQILCPLIFIKGFGNVACYQVAISTGNEKKQTLAYIIGGIINVGMNTVLIPILNQNGAALASVVSEGMLNLVIFLQLRKISGIHIEKKYFESVVLSSVCMGGVVKGILVVGGESFVFAMCAIMVGVLVYGICTYVTKNKVALEIISQLRKLVFNKRKRE